MSQQENKPQQDQPERARENMEFLKSVFEQHWLHVRHIENERLWFTNIFGIIVAGLLAVVFTSKDLDSVHQILPFLGYVIFVLAIIGYFLCLSWRAPFLEHTTLANRMLIDLQLGRYIPYITNTYRNMKIGWLTIHELFLYFYATVAGGALFLALCVQIKPLRCPYWWISVIVFISLCLLWRLFLRKREITYRREMNVREM